MTLNQLYSVWRGSEPFNRWREVRKERNRAAKAAVTAAIFGLLILLIVGCGDSDEKITGPAGPQGPGGTVHQFEAVGLGSASVNIPPNGSYTLRLIGRDAQGNAVPLSGITTSSSDPSVATITSAAAGSNDAGEPFTDFGITAGGVEGTTNLTFRDAGTDSSLTVPVRVSAVSDLTCCGGSSNVTLQPGSTQTVSVSARDGQGNLLSNVDVGASSSNPTLFTVSGATRTSSETVEFTVTGLLPGSGQLSLSGGGVQKNVQVNVEGLPGPGGGGGGGNPVSGLQVDGALNGTFNVGPSESGILTVTARDSTGSPVAGAVITGSSSNPAVVTVAPVSPGSNQFNVLGLAPGTATITFRDQGSGTEETVSVTVS